MNIEEKYIELQTERVRLLVKKQYEGATDEEFETLQYVCNELHDLEDEEPWLKFAS